jgi:hypothetical protein
VNKLLLQLQRDCVADMIYGYIIFID